MRYNVLIIEDDKDLSNLLKNCLSKKEIYADTADTGASGLALLNENKDYQLVVLDIMLPDIDGFGVLTEIRQLSKIPVFMLTAKNEEKDKVKGLMLGADDYLTKPFGVQEFLARVESLVRRYTVFDRAVQGEYLEAEGLKIDAAGRQVFLHDIPVELTSKEFDLLYFLAAHEKQVFTKRQIYRQVWEDEYAFDDSNIMSFISKLRKKLKDTEYIQTVRGVGYRFNGKG